MKSVGRSIHEFQPGRCGQREKEEEKIRAQTSARSNPAAGNKWGAGAVTDKRDGRKGQERRYCRRFPLFDPFFHKTINLLLLAHKVYLSYTIDL